MSRAQRQAQWNRKQQQQEEEAHIRGSHLAGK